MDAPRWEYRGTKYERAAQALREHLGASVQDIAARVGCSVWTVKKALRPVREKRAVQLLRERPNLTMLEMCQMLDCTSQTIRRAETILQEERERAKKWAAWDPSMAPDREYDVRGGFDSRWG